MRSRRETQHYSAAADRSHRQLSLGLIFIRFIALQVTEII